jgi:LmbE family N-acetylglucosaminyl deacetylase
MATLVAFHAHPDDECIAQSGTLAKAAAAGHRTVIVYATRGEVGQVADGFLDPGETLVERRMAEAQRSADLLGVARVVWLGYRDSGMMGTPENDDPSCFWQADVDEAATKLAEIVRDEDADVLTVYDVNGHYGHPDHIQVHRVGVRAGELAGTPNVLELTWDRDHLRKMMRAAIEAGAVAGEDIPDFEAEGMVFGTASEMITTRVDVRDFIDRKRSSMEAHESQVQDTGPLLAMPPEVFREAVGEEVYIRRGAPVGLHEDDVFAGIAQPN